MTLVCVASWNTADGSFVKGQGRHVHYAVDGFRLCPVIWDGFVEAEREEQGGSCTSTRAVGCSLRGSAQILQLKVERSVLLESVRVVLLD